MCVTSECKIKSEVLSRRFTVSWAHLISSGAFALASHHSGALSEDTDDDNNNGIVAVLLLLLLPPLLIIMPMKNCCR